jgi:hypothetical protein
VQAYAWSACARWGHVGEAQPLSAFNEEFVLRGPRSASLAYAIDGAGAEAYRRALEHGACAVGELQGRVYFRKRYVPHIRNRLMARDLFVPQAGIRTLSSRSPHFDPVSYHNGSIWPHDTAMLAEGLEAFGYGEDARACARPCATRTSTLRRLSSCLDTGAASASTCNTKGEEGACRVQAWSAAALLSVALPDKPSPSSQPVPVE